MADTSAPTDNSTDRHPTRNGTIGDPDVVTPDSSSATVLLPSDTGDSEYPQLRRRKVYESTLIPERKRSRAPKWVVIGLPVAIIFAGYFLLLRHSQRFVPTANRIVYSATENGSSQIWIAGLDGSGAKSLTKAGKEDVSPVFSADGNQIAFISDRYHGDRQIFIMDGDGKGMSAITHSSGAKALPAFAPANNQAIAYTSAGELYVNDTTNDSPNVLLPPPPKETSASSTEANQSSDIPITIPEFAWQPGTQSDKQYMAAVMESNGDQALAIIPPGQDPVTTRDGAPLVVANNMNLAWSPDGGLLAIAMMGSKLPDGRLLSGIFLYSAEGIAEQSAPVFAQLSGTVGPMHPVFSPDGSRIAFELWDLTDAANPRYLGLLSAPVSGGQQPTVIYRKDAERIQFAADGAIYFLSKRADGGHDLCRIQQDGSQFQRISDGVADVTGFAISPQHG